MSQAEYQKMKDPAETQPLKNNEHKSKELSVQLIYKPWTEFKENLKNENIQLTEADEKKIRYYLYFIMITASISIYLLLATYGSIYAYELTDLLGILTLLFVVSYILNCIKIYGAYKCLLSMQTCGPCMGCLLAYFCAIYVSCCVICRDIIYIRDDKQNNDKSTKYVHRESLINFAKNEEYLAAITAITGVGDTINHIVGIFSRHEAVTILRGISILWSVSMAIFGFYTLKQTRARLGWKVILCSPVYTCFPDCNKDRLVVENEESDFRKQP